MKPLVSIITPCFNSEDTIEKCILSIKNQNNSNVEHVIIDGGSSDGTIDIIKKYEGTYNIHWISERDRGIADAMNKGFKMASGTYASWLDADNFYDDTIFSKIIEVIKSNRELDLIYGDVYLVKDEKGDNLKKYTPAKNMSLKNALKKNTGGVPIQPGNFFKLEIFHEIGGFDIGYRVAGDIDFWFRFLNTNPKCLYLNETFGYYKQENSGASQTPSGVFLGLKEMLKISRKYKYDFFSEALLIFKYTKGIVYAKLKNVR